MRANGCWVAFEDEYDQERVDRIVAAIRQLRGVLAVEINVAEPADWMNAERARHDLIRKIYNALNPRDQGASR